MRSIFSLSLSLETPQYPVAFVVMRQLSSDPRGKVPHHIEHSTRVQSLGNLGKSRPRATFNLIKTKSRGQAKSVGHVTCSSSRDLTKPLDKRPAIGWSCHRVPGVRLPLMLSFRRGDVDWRGGELYFYCCYRQVVLDSPNMLFQ